MIYRLCESCGNDYITTHAQAPDGAVFYVCDECVPADDQGWTVTELEDDEKETAVDIPTEIRSLESRKAEIEKVIPLLYAGAPDHVINEAEQDIDEINQLLHDLRHPS